MELKGVLDWIESVPEPSMHVGWGQPLNDRRLVVREEDHSVGCVCFEKSTRAAAWGPRLPHQASPTTTIFQFTSRGSVINARQASMDV